ncbi:hypothetical protein LUZ63_018880 [Rhynchospora breviuscula]|uniref:Uncharacterized protein n=1 Tax=Rhynchospora breviuscula TaxID=2022672 RepID=A0A9Q0C566_9POAL|nr:hypothetical protein LUZ63_018880 [Rhynchospora breviuscula]
MTRKCSNCGTNGHNSRTCGGMARGIESGEGLRLFGVQLSIGNNSSPNMKKCFSMESLVSSSPSISASSCSTSVSSSSSLVSIVDEAPERFSNDYLSDELMGRPQERKKGIPWTEEEHRKFLAGLEKLGKGDWRGISRHFVTTRTPTQVASHAQKYFLRQITVKQKKRRSSLFDLVGAGEASPHINQSPILRDESSISDLKLHSLSINIITPQEINHQNYLNFMSSYPLSVNTEPSVTLPPSPLIPKAQFPTETPNFELSISPSSQSDQINFMGTVRVL